MKQTVGNACGTVGIIHSIANNTKQIELGKVMSSFPKPVVTHILCILRSLYIGFP